MATPVHRAPRRVRLPRSVPLVEPISSADAGFHRSAGFYVRVGTLAVVAAALVGILGLRAWSLQVLQGPSYARLAAQQAYRTVDLPGPRGAIFDSRGRLLAGINGRLVVTADRGALGTLDEHGRWTPTATGLRALGRLARLGNVPRQVLVTRIEHDVARSPYAPAVVLPRLDRGLASFLSERAAAYPFFHVAQLPVRSYPQGGLGGEFLGLLGEVSPDQIGTQRYGRAKPGQLVGQSGVEATYDRLLNGGFVRARLPVDSRGRIVGPLRVRPSGTSLPALKLTIDARLQRVAERAIRHGIALAHENGHTDARAGAAVVINPWTGGVYALASYPDYNQLLAAHDPRYLARLLRAGGATPLLNRATQGLYPTGSTFKPIVAEAALASGLITPSSYLPCTGSLTVGNIVFHNVEAGINASLNLRQALSISCDTWFYRLGEQFYYRQLQGRLDMQRWASRLGFGRRTGLDVPGEAAGVVPTPAWLKKRFKQPWERIWYEGTSVNLSIGQGYLAATPLQLAVAYSALANGGTVVRPHVADQLLGEDGGRRLPFKPARRLHLPDLWAIREGLYSATHDPTGTSSSVFGTFPIPVAGKTGTAEAPPGGDHSWYASWAPASHPKVVVVVLIEHGGFGAQAAAPAAKEIYSAFFGLDRRKH